MGGGGGGGPGGEMAGSSEVDYWADKFDRAHKKIMQSPFSDDVRNKLLSELDKSERTENDHEANSAKSFGEYVKEQTGWNVTVPAYGDEIALDFNE